VPIGHANFGKATGRMGGRIVGSLPIFVGLLLRALANHEKRKNFSVFTKSEAMATLTALLESGQVTPIVARTFPLNEVPAATRCLEEGSTAGKIVITP
jgi:NADPH:quinone reductase-like Zn-dependent oxidoreductase